MYCSFRCFFTRVCKLRVYNSGAHEALPTARFSSRQLECVSSPLANLTMNAHHWFSGKYLASVELCGSILARSIRRKRSTLTLENSTRPARGHQVPTLRLLHTVDRRTCITYRFHVVQAVVGKMVCNDYAQLVEVHEFLLHFSWFH